MILVTGATGNVGAELVHALAAAGEPVRALVRDDARRAALPAGVEAAVGDLNRPDTLAPALEGVRGVHLLAGYARLPDALEHMRRAGVERVTLQSRSAAPSGDTTNAVARYHIESEAAIRDSGLEWTFLQPNGFMSNALQWAEQLRQGDVVTAPVRERPDGADRPARHRRRRGRRANEGRPRRPQLPPERPRVPPRRRARRDPRLGPGARPAPRAAVRRKRPRGDEQHDAGGVRRRVLRVLRRGHTGRVRGVADRRAGPRPPAPHLRRMGARPRGRVSLSQPRGTTNAAIATKSASAAAITKRLNSSWKPKTLGFGSGRLRM